MLPNQRHERTGTMVLLADSSLRLYHPDQSLRFPGRTDRDDQAAAHLQLRHERSGNRRSSGGYQNSIIGSIGTPTERTVKTFDGGVVNAELSDASLSFTCQIANALDRVNLGRYF